PYVANPQQDDTDGDEIGDECEAIGCVDVPGDPEFDGCPNPGVNPPPTEDFDSGESCSLSKSSKAGIYTFLPFLLFASLIAFRRYTPSNRKTVSRKRRSPKRARSRAARA
ncbi:MAG: hypothetical protein U1D33_01605, partial [bacterium]|nr:hypothetical protein [bacterium]